MMSDDTIELRFVVPRDQLMTAAPAPDYYSQENCGLLGLTHRAFLELLRSPGAPPARKIGKLRLVERAAMLRFIERQPTAERRTKRDEELSGADRVLLEIGCAPKRRAAG